MNRLIIPLFIVLIAFQLNAQNGAAINTTGSPADPSAMLDISSGNSGILIPRMTEAQKNAISSPATGLMIFQTDAVTGFWYFNGTSWTQAIGPIGPTGVQGIQGTTGPQGIQGLTGPTGATGPLIIGTAGQTLRHDGTGWVANSTLYNSGTNIGIGTTSPNASASLELGGINSGLLINRLTTAQRNTIAAPAEGLQIYNITTKCLEIYSFGVWQNVFCATCPAPSAPSAGTHIPGVYQIEWVWNSVSGATGYKYNTTNNYASATDNGNNTGFVQTGLSCNTSYTLYVWAYSSCNNSSATTLTQSTNACPWTCGNDLVVSHVAGSFAPVDKTVTYGTVSSSLSGATKCWITKNLGATNQATAVGDLTEAAAGWFWQFNKAQGYKHDGSNRTPGTTWITSISEALDFQSANDPCTNLLGSGWRIPTNTEWTNTDYNAGWTQMSHAYASVFKLHAAGRLYYSSGNLELKGSNGFFWTSTRYDNTMSWLFSFTSSSCDMNVSNKAHAFTIRCLKD